MSIMKLKEINKDTYDVNALLDEELGAIGTPERKMNTDKASSIEKSMSVRSSSYRSITTKWLSAIR